MKKFLSLIFATISICSCSISKEDKEKIFAPFTAPYEKTIYSESYRINGSVVISHKIINVNGQDYLVFTSTTGGLVVFKLEENEAN